MNKKEQKSKMRKANVYIINRSGHDFSPAQHFGNLIFLTDGLLDSYDSNKHFREIWDILKDAQPFDYLLITGLASCNAIAGWIMGRLNFPLKLLIWKDGKYLERTIVFNKEKEKCN